MSDADKWFWCTVHKRATQKGYCVVGSLIACAKVGSWFTQAEAQEFGAFFDGTYHFYDDQTRAVLTAQPTTPSEDK